MDKCETYREILVELSGLFLRENDRTVREASAAALLHFKLGFFWTGFYRVDGEKLTVGPYQGPLACLHIPFGKGVCGTAWKESRSIVVQDVEEFPGHIACSSLSKSEIVIPIWHKGTIKGVIDIDSDHLNNFDDTDRRYLEYISALMNISVRADMKKYIEQNIIPLYRNFDAGHGPDHAKNVIIEALMLSSRYDVDQEMIYAAAAYHDTGLCTGRETHHIESGHIIRNDRALLEWFSLEQIEQIAQAAEDHRASSEREPRSTYGKIIAEADRLIDSSSVIRRVVEYSLSKFKGLSDKEHIERCCTHLKEKYGNNGYLKLWIPHGNNARNLEQLRQIISDEELLHEIVQKNFKKKKEQC
ncbi:MAG: GAF domain-containing protein [Alistipes sp.]|nr:GAF domain-containing protein [Candidatus Alistipes equi]